LAQPIARPWQWTAAAVLILEFLLGGGAWALMSRQGWIRNAAPLPVLLAIAALVAGTLGISTFASLSPRRALGRVALGLALVTGLAVTFGGSAIRVDRPAFQGAIPCGMAESMVALVPLALLLFLLNRFAARPVQALLAAVTASGVGMLVLHFHCPNGAPLHLFLGHIFPGLLLGLLAVGARQMFRTRIFAP
jgi:hypothetical protein